MKPFKQYVMEMDANTGTGTSAAGGAPAPVAGQPQVGNQPQHAPQNNPDKYQQLTQWLMQKYPQVMQQHQKEIASQQQPVAGGTPQQHTSI